MIDKIIKLLIQISRKIDIYNIKNEKICDIIKIKFVPNSTNNIYNYNINKYKYNSKLISILNHIEINNKTIIALKNVLRNDKNYL